MQKLEQETRAEGEKEEKKLIENSTRKIYHCAEYVSFFPSESRTCVCSLFKSSLSLRFFRPANHFLCIIYILWRSSFIFISLRLPLRAVFRFSMRKINIDYSHYLFFSFFSPKEEATESKQKMKAERRFFNMNFNELSSIIIDWFASTWPHAASFFFHRSSSSSFVETFFSPLSTSR